MAAETERFINDYYDEEMYVGLVVRSRVERAEILSISYPNLPKEITLLDADAVPGRNELALFGRTMPLLAERRVNHVGEPILLLCGPDERDLRELAENIEVRYATETPLAFGEFNEEQIAGSREIVAGDVERMFSDAFQVVEGEYRTAEQEHVVSDAQGAFVRREGTRLSVVSPTQWPFHVRSTVAGALGMAADRVVVEVSAMSLHKDARIWYPSLVAAHAALLAQASGRPVKLILPREESSQVTPKRAPSRIRIRTALDREGTPAAQDIELFVDGGAYPLLAEELLDRAVLAAAGPYRTPHLRIRASLLETSKAPMDAFLGLGLAQGAFASETHASRIAELSQIDPFTWKGDNLVEPGESFAGGAVPASYPPRQLLSQVAALSDFRRKHAAYEMLKKRRDTIRERTQPLRGIGLSVSFQGGGFVGRREEEGPYSVVVRLEADGKLQIQTSGVSVDGVARSIWQDSAWKVLGIERKNIICRELSTRGLPDSGPSAFSRNITTINTLIVRCCQTIARRRFRSGLPIEVKKSYRSPRAHRWSPETGSGMPFPTLSWASAVVETEVDPVTFETSVRGIWMLVAAGELFDAQVARRTIENGIFHALWWCSSAHGSLREPEVDRLPPITIEFLTPESRAAACGVEELAGSVIPSAYVSAVAQATGRYFDALPVTPEAIHRYTEDL